MTYDVYKVIELSTTKNTKELLNFGSIRNI